MKFEITLTLTVEAASAAAALDLGIGAAEHLTETFNDDGSLDERVRVESRPLKSPPTLGDVAACRHCGAALNFRGPIFGWRDTHSGRHCKPYRKAGGPGPVIYTKHAPVEAP